MGFLFSFSSFRKKEIQKKRGGLTEHIALVQTVGSDDYIQVDMRGESIGESMAKTDCQQKETWVQRLLSRRWNTGKEKEDSGMWPVD